MLAVIAHREDAFRLVDSADRDVGWVRSETVGFSGFASQDAALDGVLSREPIATSRSSALRAAYQVG